MTRILSQSGNVIAADFRPRVGMTINLEGEWLYSDDAVAIYRVRIICGGKPCGVHHFAANLATGTVTTL